MAEGTQLPAEHPPHDALLRDQLLERRRRLAGAPHLAGRGDLRALIHEVDAALERLGAGAFGLCDACHEPIERDRLSADPLTRVCLGCLSEEQARALERDLELAASIQRALLPARPLSADGWQIDYRYRPLGPVSGDHVDVLQAASADGTLHFMVGDVSGKGVAASILMGNLHAILRSLIPQGLPLAELVERANRVFNEGTAPSSFATLVAGRLSSTGAVELVNAGHNPPLVARAQGLSAVCATGLPLGMLAGARFESVSFELGAGDLLFLYTDGLSEAVDAAGEQYGEQRIEGVVGALHGHPVDAVIRTSLDELGRFRGDRPLADDLTVMVVRRAA